MSRFKFFLVNELHEKEIDEFFQSNKIIKWQVTNQSGIPTICIQYLSGRLFNAPSRFERKEITKEDIELVQQQTNSSFERATNALIKCNGDLAKAILDITREED